MYFRARTFLKRCLLTGGSLYVYLYGVLCRFQCCTGHITTGSWKGRGKQHIQLVTVLYCKLPTNSKQLQLSRLTLGGEANSNLRYGRRQVSSFSFLGLAVTSCKCKRPSSFGTLVYNEVTSRVIKRLFFIG